MPYNKRIILHLIAIMDLEDLIQCFSYGRLKKLFVFHRSKSHWCRLKYYKDETFVPDFIKVLRYIKKYSSYLITFIKWFIYLTDKIWLEQDFKPSWFDEIILFYFQKKKRNLNSWLYSNRSKNFPQMDNDDQRRIEDPVERLRWRFFQKSLHSALS